MPKWLTATCAFAHFDAFACISAQENALKELCRVTFPYLHSAYFHNLQQKFQQKKVIKNVRSAPNKNVLYKFTPT